MSAFSELETGRPPGNVVVPAGAFASTWDDRPLEEVCMGLRLLADADLEDARVEAFKRASELIPDHDDNAEKTELWIASFQDALMHWIIARGTCDVNDVAKSWEGWEAAPEDMVPTSLTDRGAQHIFDAWERMRIGVDIGTPEASAEDLALLPALIERLPRLEAASRTRACRVRRLMRFALEELESMGPDPNPAT